MKTDYKIGDRVIFKHFGIEEKGTIMDEDEDDYCGGSLPLSIRESNRKFVYRIKFDIIKDNLTSSYYHVRSIRLDVQYYRELRLNKLLDESGL